MPKALELANAICANAQIAVQESAAASAWACRPISPPAPFSRPRLSGVCCGTEDKDEGMGAFLEKRAEKHFKNK